jgi:hypothetical protein
MKAKPNTTSTKKGVVHIESLLYAVPVLIEPTKFATGLLTKTRVLTVSFAVTGVQAYSTYAPSGFNNPIAVVLSKKAYDKIVAEEGNSQRYIDDAVLAYTLDIGINKDATGLAYVSSVGTNSVEMDVKIPFTEFESMIDDDFYIVLINSLLQSGFFMYRVTSDRVDVTQDEYMKYFACPC